MTNDKLNSVALIETVPDIVRETADVGEDVMAHTNVTDLLEIEAFSNNTHDEVWCREIEDCNVSVNDNNNKACIMPKSVTEQVSKCKRCALV